MLLMSQAPTLRMLSMHHDTVPDQYLTALTSLRSLVNLRVRGKLKLWFILNSCCACSQKCHLMGLVSC